MSNYILVDNKPILEPDILKWAEWFKTAKRSIARDVANVTYKGEKIGTVKVSTVFLGIDHSFTDDDDPILFETMIFGGKLDEEMERCSTYEGALIQHKIMMERVKNSLK